MLTFREVKERAAGQWDRILPALAPVLEEAVNRAPRHVDCPLHGGSKDFRLDKDFAERGSGICTCGWFSDGFELLAQAKNYSVKDALYDVAQYLGIDANSHNNEIRHTPAPKLAAPRPAPVPSSFNRKLLREAYEGSIPADGSATPLQLYLGKRGIAVSPIPSVIRFNPALPYFVLGANNRSRCIGQPPAMLAVVSDANGLPVTLHRTYLDVNGNKSPVPEPKKLMSPVIEGSAIGGAIRLFQDGKVLGLAEGIETSLAVYMATGMPVWACVCTSLLKQVVIPPTVELVVIWADLDKVNRKTGVRPGEEAANVLAERLKASGHAVQIMIPPGTVGPDQKGIDWLDIFTQHGREAFPLVIWGGQAFGAGKIEIEPETPIVDASACKKDVA